MLEEIMIPNTTSNILSWKVAVLFNKFSYVIFFFCIYLFIVFNSNKVIIRQGNILPLAENHHGSWLISVHFIGRNWIFGGGFLVRRDDASIRNANNSLWIVCAVSHLCVHLFKKNSHSPLLISQSLSIYKYGVTSIIATIHQHIMPTGIQIMSCK